MPACRAGNHLAGTISKWAVQLPPANDHIVIKNFWGLNLDGREYNRWLEIVISFVGFVGWLAIHYCCLSLISGLKSNTLKPTFSNCDCLENSLKTHSPNSRSMRPINGKIYEFLFVTFPPSSISWKILFWAYDICACSQTTPFPHLDMAAIVPTTQSLRYSRAWFYCLHANFNRIAQDWSPNSQV